MPSSRSASVDDPTDMRLALAGEVLAAPPKAMGGSPVMESVLPATLWGG